MSLRSVSSCLASLYVYRIVAERFDFKFIYCASAPIRYVTVSKHTTRRYLQKWKIPRSSNRFFFINNRSFYHEKFWKLFYLNVLSIRNGYNVCIPYLCGSFKIWSFFSPKVSFIVIFLFVKRWFYVFYKKKIIYPNHKYVSFTVVYF